MARDRGDFRRGSIGGNIRNAVERIRERGEHVLQAGKDALKDGVDIVVTDAKSRCPVDTGKLRDSIRGEESSGFESGVAYDIVADAKSDDGYPYGQIVEFSPRVNKPFLYPAMEANRQRISDMVKTAMQHAAESN